LEILYEPEIGWFKCISSQDARPNIEEFIQAQLEDIIEGDILMMDPDDHGEGLKDEYGNLIDIDIISDDNKVLPWATYTDKASTNLGEYDPWRFPAIMGSKPFKDVWRGLERLQTPSKRYQQLLIHAAELCGSVEMTYTAESLGKLFECDIQYNMKQTLLYIGSRDKEHLAGVLSRLDNIVSRMVSASFL
jgi:hypothetical protein